MPTTVCKCTIEEHMKKVLYVHIAHRTQNSDEYTLMSEPISHWYVVPTESPQKHLQFVRHIESPQLVPTTRSRAYRISNISIMPKMISSLNIIYSIIRHGPNFLSSTVRCGTKVAIIAFASSLLNNSCILFESHSLVLDKTTMKQLIPAFLQWFSTLKSVFFASQLRILRS